VIELRVRERLGPELFAQIEKRIAVVEPNSGQHSASFRSPVKPVTFALRLFTQANAQCVLHHLTNRYALVGGFAL